MRGEFVELFVYPAGAGFFQCDFRITIAPSGAPNVYITRGLWWNDEFTILNHSAMMRKWMRKRIEKWRRASRVRAHERVRLIREDLMRATWAPHRLEQTGFLPFEHDDD